MVTSFIYLDFISLFSFSVVCSGSDSKFYAHFQISQVWPIWWTKKINYLS